MIKSIYKYIISNPAVFFVVVAGAIGLGLVFLIPPFQSPDEHTHFYKAVSLARGQVKGEVLQYRVGAFLPAKYSNTAGHYSYMYLDHNIKFDIGILKRDLTSQDTNSKTIPTAYENTAVYPPLPYMPQAIAIAVTKIMTGSVLLQMYAARIAVLSTWLILTFLAIKILPFGKWGAVAIALTPQALFLSASVSGDAVMFSTCLLFIAVALGSIVRTGPISAREFALLATAALVLGMFKAPYFLLAGMLFGIPVKRFGSKKQYIMRLVCVCLITLVAAMLWQSYVKDILINVFPGSSNSGQLRFIITHPWNAGYAIINTLFIHPIGDSLILEIVGLKAWVDVHMPLWQGLVIYGTIIMLLVTDPAVRGYKYLRNSRIISATILCLGITAICLLLYITFTPVGKDIIIGLQGRYFTPFLYLLIPILAGLGSSRAKSGASKTIPHLGVYIGIVSIMALSTLVMTFVRYYPL